MPLWLAYSIKSIWSKIRACLYPTQSNPPSLDAEEYKLVCGLHEPTGCEEYNPLTLSRRNKF